MKYAELMDKIELTPEMRERVLSGVERKLDRNPARGSRLLRRCPPFAACLALVIAAAVVLPQAASPGVEYVPGIEPARDAASLSDAVGYEVRDVSGLPFEPDAAVYTAYGDMAEIDYSGEGEQAVYRQSPGAEDNSGDYNEYAAVTTTTVGDAQVTLKGGAPDSYTLALWSSGGYSYSLSLSSPLPESAWIELIETNVQ